MDPRLTPATYSCYKTTIYDGLPSIITQQIQFFGEDRYSTLDIQFNVPYGYLIGNTLSVAEFFASDIGETPDYNWQLTSGPSNNYGPDGILFPVYDADGSIIVDVTAVSSLYANHYGYDAVEFLLPAGITKYKVILNGGFDEQFRPRSMPHTYSFPNPNQEGKTITKKKAAHKKIPEKIKKMK